MGIISQKLRDSANGQDCTVRSPFCNHDKATVVLAHLPSPIKGMGNKGDDFFAVNACSGCHVAMDLRLPKPTWSDTPIDWPALQLAALQRTQRVWFESDLLKVPVTKKRKKASGKAVERRSMFVASDGAAKPESSPAAPERRWHGQPRRDVDNDDTD